MEPHTPLTFEALTLVLFGYGCGLLPTGPFLARRAGVDLRHHGSGNVGATNVLRTAGPRLGALTLLGDALKGALPVLLAQHFSTETSVPAAVAVAAVCGHVFPVTSRFRGGKGVATAIGALGSLAPTGMAIAIASFVVALSASRIVSVGSLAAAAVAPGAMFALGSPRPTVLAAIAITTLIWICHRDNLVRIANRTEPRVWMSNKQASPKE